jgi:hypothetical protein
LLSIWLLLEAVVVVIPLVVEVALEVYFKAMLVLHLVLPTL